MLGDIVLQCGQVLTVFLLSPLLHGFMVTMEERVQRGQGPSIFQPYRDLWKLFHKTLLIPESASWVFFWAPVVAFTAMLIVPMLIPVLTNFPLPLSDMGDILGGGLILTLGGFFILLAGLDTGQPFGGLGSSRAVMLAILAEPTLILVFVGITFSRSLHAALRRQSPAGAASGSLLEPGAYLSDLRFFHPADGGNGPPAHPLHHPLRDLHDRRGADSGVFRAIAGLLKWASWMKQFLLYTIFSTSFSFRGDCPRRAAWVRCCSPCLSYWPNMARWGW
jgi:Formate hydrogenlyase subunit 4